MLRSSLQPSSENGSLLLRLLMAGSLILGAAVMVLKGFTSQRHLTETVSKKVVAELFAAELLDFFRSLPAATVKSYLSNNPVNPSLTPYPLCAHVNLLDRTSGNLLNEDSLAALPTLNALGNTTASPVVQPNRFYQVQVIDLTTMKLDSSFCSLTAAQIALPNQFVMPGQTQLSVNQRLYVTVGVTWTVPSSNSNPVPNRVTLNTVLFQ